VFKSLVKLLLHVHVMEGKTGTMNNTVCVFLTLFYKLYKHRVIAAHCQPKAILIFLDDDTTLHKP